MHVRFPPICTTLAGAIVAGAALLAGGCGSGGAVPTANIGVGESESKAQGENADLATLTEPVQLHANSPSTLTPAPAWRQPEKPFPQVKIQTNRGDIRLQLDAQASPATVENFLANYVDQGFYNGTVFHYVDKGFMIVGGGFNENLEALETQAYLLNEASNGLKNVRGTIAMIRQPDQADTATSQFFINLADNPSLDHQDANDPQKFGYCVFGKVIEGMNVVDAIAQAKVADQGDFPKTPVEPIVILAVERLP